MTAPSPKILADVEKTAGGDSQCSIECFALQFFRIKIFVQISVSEKMVVFPVKDFDKGIEVQYRDRLFDRYFQVPAHGQNKSG